MKNILITLTLAATAIDLQFNVSHAEMNRYINDADAAGKNKIQPAFNFLSRTVEESHREDFNALLLDENRQPKGILVMTVFGEVFKEFNEDVVVAVKKPSNLEMD